MLTTNSLFIKCANKRGHLEYLLPNIMEENLLLQISEMAQRFSLPIIKPSLTASLPLAWRENPKRRKFQ